MRPSRSRPRLLRPQPTSVGPARPAAPPVQLTVTVRAPMIEAITRAESRQHRTRGVCHRGVLDVDDRVLHQKNEARDSQADVATPDAP